MGHDARYSANGHSDSLPANTESGGTIWKEWLGALVRNAMRDNAVYAPDNRDHLGAAVSKVAEQHRQVETQIGDLLRQMRETIMYSGGADVIYGAIVSAKDGADDIVRSYEQLPKGASVKRWENHLYRTAHGISELLGIMVGTIEHKRHEWEQAGRFPELVVRTIDATIESLPVYAAELAKRWKGDIGLGPIIATAGIARTKMATRRPASVGKSMEGETSKNDESTPANTGDSGGWRLGLALYILAERNPKDMDQVLGELLVGAVPEVVAQFRPVEGDTIEGLVKHLRNRLARAIEQQAEMNEQGRHFKRLDISPLISISDEVGYESTSGKSGGIDEDSISLERWQANEHVEGLSEDFEHILARLTEKQRNVFLLDYAGYTDVGIAEHLGIATGTVKSHLSRARANLSRQLADYRAS